MVSWTKVFAKIENGTVVGFTGRSGN